MSFLGPTVLADDGTHHGPNWCTVDTINSGGSALTTNWRSANAIYLQGFPAGNLADMLVVPAAFTVRITCADPFNTASGIVYVGQCRQRVELGISDLTFGQIGDNLISFTNPKSYTAASLLMRPVEVSAVPMDMSELSNFTELSQGGNGPNTATSGSFSHSFAGFAPIYVYNPSGANLNIEITTEWRARHKFDSPFQSSMPLHAPAAEGSWAAAISATLQAGAHYADELTSTVGAIKNVGASVNKLLTAGRQVAPLLAMT